MRRHLQPARTHLRRMLTAAEVSSRVDSAGWRPGLPPALARRACEVATEVAHRATDPDLIAEAGRRAARQSAYPSTVHWSPQSIAQGNAGIALLAGQLDACFSDFGWDTVAHDHLAAAARAAERLDTGPSSFGGSAGMGLAATIASRGGTRYQRLLAALDASVTAAVAGPWPGGLRGLPVSAFDAISGLSGVCGYLLHRVAKPGVRAALEYALGQLAALAEPVDPPRWLTPAHLQADESMAARYPSGNLNCGLAHGIPGPLAVLSLASLSGVAVPGQDAAIASLADWLARHRVDDRWGINWPNVVPAAASISEPPARAAWCYGSPGVARALWLAGRALDDGSLEELAVAAMAAVYERPVHSRGIDSPTFCHGIAGLLQITLRFAAETGRPLFTTAAATLTEQLLSYYDPDRILGYSSIEPDGRRVDQPGLLDGAPGVALALLAAGTGTPPAWDRLFLLA
jgi:class I lanthipeptide synthase